MAIATVNAGVLTSGDVTQLGYVSLANYLKNKPIDQIAVQRPLLKALMAKKKPWGGGVGASGGKMIVEQVRTSYGAGQFKWFGDDTTNVSDDITFSTRDTVRQVFYPWNSAHDGFKFSEDFLIGNGILISDSQSPRNSGDASLVQLTNVFNEAMEVLRLGFEEQLDLSLHLDGQYTVGASPTASATINGLDFLVSMQPDNGTVAGIDRSVSANSYWRNNFDYGLGLNLGGTVPVAKGYASGSLLSPMHAMWRQCQKNGGSPNFIIAGQTFIDGYDLAASAKLSRYAVQPGSAQAPWNLDPSTEVKDWGTFTGLFFEGVPIIWDPTFDTAANDKDSGNSNDKNVPWTQRCYFLNLNHLFLRPIEGNDMIARKPPREHTSFNYYWGMTWRGALTANRMNCHGVISASGV